MSDHPPHSPTKLDRHWLTEAVRLTEGHSGPLEDAEANRRARANGGDLGARILNRAEFLAERAGLTRALIHWRQSASLLTFALGLFALALGAGLATAALEGEQPVNVFWALGSLLGLHLLALLVWLASFAAAGGGAIGRLWLWLSSKLARDGRTVPLGAALLSLLTRTGLGRWGLGALTHAFWVLALGAALLMLLAMLSAKRYGFTWETTLLSADTFVALTRALGALPSLLGFPLPDAAMVRASHVASAAGTGDEAIRQAWAGWLLGALVVYGILPRLALSLVCAGLWRRGLRALAVDVSLPEHAILRDRLEPPSESLGVSDPAEPEAAADAAATGVTDGHGAALVAIELDERHPWPPVLPTGVADAGGADSRTERQCLLERLTQSPPARLAIACDPQRSVDRGTLHLIGELSRLAAATRVWLVAPPAGAAIDEARLQQWHAAVGELGVATVEDEPLAWLETGDG